MKRMAVKRMFATILAGCMLLLCASCGRRGNADPTLSDGGVSSAAPESVDSSASSDVSSDTSSGEEIPTAELDSPFLSCTVKEPGEIGYGEQYQLGDYQDFLHGYSMQSESRAETEQGFYFVAGNHAGDYLFYASRDTMQPIPLCNKPNCQHHLRKDPETIAETDEDALEELMKFRMECNAYVYDLKNLSYVDGWLYGTGNIDPLTNDLALYRISLDGTVKEKLHSFIPEDYVDETGTNSYAGVGWMINIHRGYVYYDVSSGDFQTLYRIPLDNLEATPEEVCRDVPAEAIFQYYDHYIYFPKTEQLEEDNPDQEPTKYDVRVDLDTKETVQFPCGYGIAAFCEGSILRCDAQPGQNHEVYLTDLDGSNRRVLMKFEEGETVDLGGGYYIRRPQNAPGGAPDGRYTFTFYDKDCNEQGKLEVVSDRIPLVDGATKDVIFFRLGFHGETTIAYYDLKNNNGGIFDPFFGVED